MQRAGAQEAKPPAPSPHPPWAGQLALRPSLSPSPRLNLSPSPSLNPSPNPSPSPRLNQAALRLSREELDARVQHAAPVETGRRGKRLRRVAACHPPPSQEAQGRSRLPAAESPVSPCCRASRGRKASHIRPARALGAFAPQADSRPCAEPAAAFRKSYWHRSAIALRCEVAGARSEGPLSAVEAATHHARDHGTRHALMSRPEVR